MSEAANNAMEVTVLPAGGFNRGGDILYVDGADGLGNQPYFDGSFMVLGLRDRIDRFDVRGPGTPAANRLSSRVTNVANQLSACYREILWDTGSLSLTLGDGSGGPLKTDDYGLLNTFLGNLASPGGVYLCGDDVAEYLDGYAGASAVAFRSTYMPFTLINHNHRLAPTLFRISPNVMPWPGRAFSDNFFAFGGCLEINDFDVIGASGTSQVQMSYNTASSPNGAVVSNANGNARVVLSGFSFVYIRDNELNGILDRAQHLRDVLFSLGAILPVVSGADPEAPMNSLAQNYPNPFNPQTTIAFTIKTRGHAQLSVYDVGGRLVRTLANEVRAAGPQQVTWDGRNGAGEAVASGVYFYRLVAGDFSQTKKMVLLK